MRIGIVLRAKDLIKESGENIIKKVLSGNHGIEINKIKEIDYTWVIDDFLDEHLFWDRHNNNVLYDSDIFVVGDIIFDKLNDYKGSYDDKYGARYDECIIDQIENCLYRSNYIDDIDKDIIMFMEVE